MRKNVLQIVVLSLVSYLSIYAQAETVEPASKGIDWFELIINNCQ